VVGVVNRPAPPLQRAPTSLPPAGARRSLITRSKEGRAPPRARQSGLLSADNAWLALQPSQDDSKRSRRASGRHPGIRRGGRAIHRANQDPRAGGVFEGVTRARTKAHPWTPAVNKTLMVASALMTGAFSSALAQPSSSVLQSLPAEVQRAIEDVRAACRTYLVAQDKDPNESWISSTANGVAGVSSGDDALIQFTVSGAQAVMVSDLELCGGQCLRGANCSNRASYPVQSTSVAGVSGGRPSPHRRSGAFSSASMAGRNPLHLRLLF
jgi:hypothetical protein